jgi:hypothetical protein
MNRKYLLLSIGILMLMSWVWIFGISTFTLISQILNDEPYYFDNTFLYFLAFALAPFVLNSYIDGLNFVREISSIKKFKQKMNFLLLFAFALLLLFASIATYYAFFDTYMYKKLSLEFFILLIPISFTFLFLFLIQFLYRTSIKK